MCVHLAEQDYAGSHQLPCLIAPYGGALGANTKGQKEVLWDYPGERRNGGEVGMIKEYIIKIDEDTQRKDINGGYPLLELPQELIRCKDCKHGAPTIINGVWLSVTCGDVDHRPEWFCANGKRRNANE